KRVSPRRQTTTGLRRRWRRNEQCHHWPWHTSARSHQPRACRLPVHLQRTKQRSQASKQRLEREATTVRARSMPWQIGSLRLYVRLGAWCVLKTRKDLESESRWARIARLRGGSEENGEYSPQSR